MEFGHHWKTILYDGWLYKVEQEVIPENIYYHRKSESVLAKFSNNPFRILGLPADIDSKTAYSAHEKMLKKISLGLPVISEYDYPFLEKIHRNVGVLQNAYYELQNGISGLFWVKIKYDGYINEKEKVQKRFYCSDLNISKIDYDDFVISFYFIILNDPLCNRVFHWIYLIKMIGLLIRADDSYWKMIISERCRCNLIEPSVEQIKNYFINTCFDIIRVLINDAILSKNIKRLEAWFQVIGNSDLDNSYFIEIVGRIKRTADDIAEDIHCSLSEQFKKMINDSKNESGIDVIKKEDIKEDILNYLNSIYSVFNIIDINSQQGKRIGEPLFKLLRIIANIYLREGYCKECKIFLIVARKCCYCNESYLLLQKDEIICDKFLCDIKK